MTADRSKAPDKSLRHWLDWLLHGDGAHVDFDAAVRGLPLKLRGAKAPGLPHTCWELLEHMRIAQWDILEFSRSASHVSPKWPDEYWPDKTKEASADDWRGSVESFREDLRAVEALVEDPSTDLYAKIPHGDGQTILREALLVADHNAYHLGALVTLRRALEDAGGAESNSG